MLSRGSPGAGNGLRQSPPPSTLPVSRPALFQQVRDWTAFFVSITSLVTATFALRNTLTGPIPVLADLMDSTATILRSDQFVLASAQSPSIVLREETGRHAEFPLVIMPVTISNRAAPPNGISVRSIDGTLSIFQVGRTVYQSEYTWYRFTTSSSAPDREANADRLVIESASPVAPFDVAGGSTWSREVLMVPRETWAAQSWTKFRDGVIRDCEQQCRSRLSIRVRFDDGRTLTAQCSFAIDRHIRAHAEGKERSYFTTPTCSSTRAS